MATAPVTPTPLQDPMLAAFQARAQQTRPAQAAQSSQTGQRADQANSAADPMLAAFQARAKQNQQPQAQEQGQQEGMTAPGTGRFNAAVQNATQHFTQGLGIGNDWSIGNLIQTAKQAWQSKQEEAKAEALMAANAVSDIKAGNYGQAAETLLGHIGKRSIPGQAAQQTVNEIKPIARDVQRGDYSGAAGDVASTALKVGGALAAPEAVEGKLGLAGEAEEGSPGLLKQIWKGKEVAQPGAKEAVRSAVKSSAESAGTADESMMSNIENRPLQESGRTVVDEHLNALAGKEKAAYQKLDEAAGFDLKAEKTQLANDQYKLKQLGNTTADQATREQLTSAINDSQARIAQAEAKLQKAGISPREADAMHQQRMAGQDFRKVLINYTNADGSVNVDGLLKASNKLRYAKNGDRLEQFLGSKEAADNFVGQLQQMKELGAHAVTARKIAAITGGILGLHTANRLVETALAP
jgi:hypothetical protein